MKLKIFILIMLVLVFYNSHVLARGGASHREQKKARERRVKKEEENRRNKRNSENVFAEEDYQREMRRKLGTLPPSGCSTCPKCSASDNKL